MESAEIFNVLATTDIAYVDVFYSGSNDEGYVDEVQPEEESNTILSHEIKEELRALTYDLLETARGGWENNEGAEGYVRYDVKARTATLHHSIYVLQEEEPEQVL